MNKLTAYVAGVVSALALSVAGLAVVTATIMAPASAAESHDLAAEFGVEIVWFDEGQSPKCADTNVAGCFDDGTPNVIYIQRDLGEYERSVILHEIGHALHHRLGIESNECAADEFARSMGATWFGYEC